MKNLFKHDCDRCIFLDSYKKTDLYVCSRNLVIDTVIARFSDEGSDYCSGLPFAMGNRLSKIRDLLVEAKERAIKLGHKLPDWAHDYAK